MPATAFFQCCLTVFHTHKSCQVRSCNMVNSFPADTIVPAFLPSSDHSLSFFYAKLSQHSVFLWCLCVHLFTQQNLLSMVKYKHLFSIFPSDPFGCDNGGQVLDSDRLSETQRCSWFQQNIQYKGCSPELTSTDRGTHQGKTISFVRLCSFFRTASQIQYFTVNKQRKKAYSSWFPRKFPSGYEVFQTCDEIAINLFSLLVVRS